MKMPCSATAMEVLTDAGTKDLYPNEPRAAMSLREAAEKFVKESDNVVDIIHELLKLSAKRVPFGDVDGYRAVFIKVQHLGQDIYEGVSNED